MYWMYQKFGIWRTNWSKLYYAKSPSRKGILNLEEKETAKAMSKGSYIWIYLAFEGWWSIFWEMVGSAGYILVDGGWWVVVGDGGDILAGGGWWWVYFRW